MLDEDEKKDTKLIGYVETTLTEIVTCKDQILRAPLKYDAKKEQRGTLVIQADYIKNCTDDIRLAFKGSLKTQKMFFCFGSD